MVPIPPAPRAHLVLAAAVLPLGETLVTAQNERDLRAGLRDIRRAIDRHKEAADAGQIARPTDSGYPASLEVLTGGAPDLRPGLRDEDHRDARRPATPSWGRWPTR